ncbi:MAG TPA: radical SAM protein, partial [Myxococcales bacterium]|nr:radical SAM protein [Myxococcales bacterium]
PDQYAAVAERHSAGGRRVGIAGLLRRLKRARKGLVVGNFARALGERGAGHP